MQNESGGSPRRWYARRWVIGVASLVGALAIAVPIAWASDLFTDVPASNAFHDDIGAIARAGVTRGCGTNVYCPSDNVTREAMAAFLHRGFGRVAFKFLPNASVPSAAAVPAGWTLSITPGLPAGALAGAAGFLKVDGEVSVCNNTATLRTLHARILVDGVANGGSPTYLSLDVDNSSGECGNMALNGAARITTSGAHTASVQIDGGDGNLVLANGHLTITYFPFGSTGTNILGESVASSASGGLDR